MGDDPVGAETGPEQASGENIGKRVFAGGSWRTLAFAFASALGVVMTAVVSRSLGPPDFALFTTAMSLVTIALSLSDVGLLALGIREYAARPVPERDRGQRALITLRLLASIVTSIGIVAFAVAKQYPTDLIWGLVAAGFGVCALSLFMSYTVPLQATYRLGQVAALEAGRQTIQASLMIVCAVVFASAGWVIAVFLPTGVVMAVVAGLVSRKMSPVLPGFNLKEIWSFVALAGAFAITAAFGSNYAYVAQIVSGSVLSAHESGMFSMAFRVFVVVAAAFATAVGGAFPLFVTTSGEGDRARLAYATRRLLQSALLAGVGVSVLLITGAGFAIALLGGAEFADATPALAAIGLAVPGSYLAVVLAMNLLAEREHRTVVTVTVIGAVLGVCVTAAAATSFGPVGAAVGIIVGEYVIALSYAVKVAMIDRRSVPTIGWITGVVAVGVFACLPALLAVPSFVSAMAAGILFIILTALLKLIPPELTDPIRSRLGREGG
jgi:O-antigen/teichoic acid export membrane protein